MAVLRVDDPAFERAQRLLQAVAGGVEKAGRKAINDTLRFVRASAVRKITAKLNIKAARVREAIFIDRARRAKLQGEVGFFRLAKRIPITKDIFGARQRRKGVSYKITKAGQRKLIPGAWLSISRGWAMVRVFMGAAELGSIQATRPGAVRRGAKGDADASERVGRRPIIPVFGPSPLRIFEGALLRTVESEAAEKLEERLEFHVDDLLRKAGL